MSDERLRSLERTWQRTESEDDEANVLIEQVRKGIITQERLHLAAILGHPASRKVMGEEAPTILEQISADQGIDHLSEVILLLASARLVLSELHELTLKRGRGRQTEERLERWLMDMENAWADKDDQPLSQEELEGLRSLMENIMLHEATSNQPVESYSSEQKYVREITSAIMMSRLGMRGEITFGIFPPVRVRVPELYEVMSPWLLGRSEKDPVTLRAEARRQTK